MKCASFDELGFLPISIVTDVKSEELTLPKSKVERDIVSVNLLEFVRVSSVPFPSLMDATEEKVLSV